MPAHLAAFAAEQRTEHDERFGFAFDGEPSFGVVHGVPPAFGVVGGPSPHGIGGAVQLPPDFFPGSVFDPQFGGLNEQFVGGNVASIGHVLASSGCGVWERSNP